jgi:hypothetical protein
MERHSVRYASFDSTGVTSVLGGQGVTVPAAPSATSQLSDYETSFRTPRASGVLGYRRCLKGQRLEHLEPSSGSSTGAGQRMARAQVAIAGHQIRHPTQRRAPR